VRGEETAVSRRAETLRSRRFKYLHLSHKVIMDYRGIFTGLGQHAALTKRVSIENNIHSGFFSMNSVSSVAKGLL
jgi:hypothetical protein